jgi:hypothetical protein
MTYPGRFQRLGVSLVLVGLLGLLLLGERGWQAQARCDPTCSAQSLDVPASPLLPPTAARKTASQEEVTERLQHTVIDQDQRIKKLEETIRTLQETANHRYPLVPCSDWRTVWDRMMEENERALSDFFGTGFFR